MENKKNQIFHIHKLKFLAISIISLISFGCDSPKNAIEDTSNDTTENTSIKQPTKSNKSNNSKNQPVYSSTNVETPITKTSNSKSTDIIDETSANKKLEEAKRKQEQEEAKRKQEEKLDYKTLLEICNKHKYSELKTFIEKNKDEIEKIDLNDSRVDFAQKCSAFIKTNKYSHSDSNTKSLNHDPSVDYENLDNTLHACQYFITINKLATTSRNVPVDEEFFKNLYFIVNDGNSINHLHLHLQKIEKLPEALKIWSNNKSKSTDFNFLLFSQKANTEL